MDRRHFLGVALGLPFAGCRPEPCPHWLPGALRSLAAERKPGLVVRVPENKVDRHTLGHDLVELLNSGNADLREALAEVQLICLDDAAVRANISGADPAHDLILIDGSGYAIDGAPFPVKSQPPPDPAEEEFQRRRRLWPSEAVFVELVRALAHGRDGRRLRDRARSDTLAARIQERLRDPSSEAGRRLRAGIEAEIDAVNPSTPGPRLPYGIVTQGQGGCGDDCEERTAKYVLLCGKGGVRSGARDFLRFISR